MEMRRSADHRGSSEERDEECPVVLNAVKIYQLIEYNLNNSLEVAGILVFSRHSCCFAPNAEYNVLYGRHASTCDPDHTQTH